MKTEKKKIGRPCKPKDEVKQRANLRLSRKQLDVIYRESKESDGLQKAIDLVIEKYDQFTQGA